MAPAARTQTTVIEEVQTSCMQDVLNHRPKAYIKGDHGKYNTGNCTQKLDVYDQMLPKNEFKFMSYVRKWEKHMGFQTPIRWINGSIIILFHVIITSLTLNGLLRPQYWPKWQTCVFAIILGTMAGFGVTAGAHRLWSHRSYKAKWPLQIYLLICYSMAGQNNVYQWVRDHRVHHKFSEESADPHNANRGFFFAHMGWLMMKKHPDVLHAGAKIDMSDIVEDPLIRFHTKYFVVFKILLCFVIPIIVPAALWNESWNMAFFQTGFRYMLSLNFTWSVNSFAHLWGNKPYDRFIMPVESKAVALVALGEGWHNYHHTFPWDYKAAELPYYINLTTSLLDMFAKFGWAYDMKVASPSLIEAVIRNRGDPNIARLLAR